VGSTAIEGSYSGDLNFIGSGGQLTEPIVVGTPTFTMAASVSSLSISPGQTGTVTLTLTPSFGYTGTVNFSCSNLPAQSVCNFGSVSTTFDGTGSPVQISLTIGIGEAGSARSSALARVESAHPLRSLPVLPAMIFWLPGTALTLDDSERKKKQRGKSKSGRMLLMIALLTIGAGALGLTGCGSGGTKASIPPAGQYTINVIATGSGNASQSIPVQVNVS
jgi:hypothetical protein